MEEGTFPCTLSGSIAEAPQIKPTKDRIAREKKFVHAMHIHVGGTQCELFNRWLGFEFIHLAQ